MSLQRINQLYAVLNQCHETIIRSKNETELFSRMCMDAVNIYGIKMAWIGLIDTDNKKLIPIAFSGTGTDYLEDIYISVDPDDPNGQGPTGIVCREDHPFWSQDFQNDPHTKPWHERAKIYGWQASAALPLHKNNKLIGTINLYANEKNIFDPMTRELLKKLTDNIDYALSSFELEKERNKAKEELINSHNLLTTIINTVPVRIFWKDKNLNFLGCNLAFANDAGKSNTQDIIGKNDYDMVWKEQAHLYRGDDRRILDSKTPKLAFEEPQTLSDGSMNWVRTSKVPLYDSDSNIIGILGIYDDITEHKLAVNALRESQEHLQAIIENEPECVKLVDANMNLLEMNPAGLMMLQVDTLEKAKEQSLENFIVPEWRNSFIDLHKKVMKGHHAQLQFEIQGVKGKRLWVETHAVPMYDAYGKITMLLGITRDITEHKKSEQHIHYLANYDVLTGLPNRIKLDEKLNSLISLSKRKHHHFVLMFIDIDNFKDINDTLGHNIGDRLLSLLGKRISEILRVEDTIARLGGDEFILLFPETDVYEAQDIAQKLLSSMHDPFYIDTNELYITISIGITIYPEDGLDKETLSKNADIAMYRAKRAGRNGYSFFTKEMQTMSKRKLQLSNALHHALDLGQFHLLYQPQISLHSGYVTGAEALLRWENPELGVISPDEFIPIAESNGLIFAIGEWVLRNALQQLKNWIEKGMDPISMSINLSALQFRYTNLSELITEILDSIDLDPKYLELELTESAAMHNPSEAIKIMNKLHDQGIRIAIDDFGTGYSSLSYLKKFKVYKLKIDQSFVQDLTYDSEDRAIVSAIIHMSKSLGIRTIAEGVETLEQLDYLRRQGCDEVQGFYFSKPLSADAFEELLTNNKDMLSSIWAPSI